MAYERPAWASGQDLPQQMKMVNIDVGEFIRTRDALTAAYLGLSASLDRAVKAYLDHTQVVLNGDAALNVSHLIQPFNVLTNHAQVAQMALQQNGAPPPVIAAVPVASEEPADGKKKRKKRAYKQRDPNAPKRPLTAYFRFLGENRAAIAKEIQDNPELYSSSGRPGDISRIATDRWNALTKDQQEPYRAAYQAALKEYEKEREIYRLQSGALGEDEGKADVSLIDPVAVTGAAQDSSSDTSDSDEEPDVVAAPAPVVAKSPKKAPAKKTKQPTTVAPAQIFTSVNPANIIADPAPVVAAPSSPERKRRATGDGEGGTKKRSRKSAADKEVVAAADPVAVAAPVAAALAPSPEIEAGGKKKKDKKKKKTDA